MPRTIDEMPKPQSNNWPPAGRHLCACVGVEKWKSPKKGTAAVMLHWVTGPQSEFAFDDPIFVTEKAVARLALAASRVCQMQKDVQIPDSDRDAAGFLARYIMEHAVGRRAYVTIEVHDEQYMPQSGPNQGRLQTIKRHKVAFAGYDKVDTVPPALADPEQDDDSPPIVDDGGAPPTGDGIPF